MDRPGYVTPVVEKTARRAKVPSAKVPSAKTDPKFLAAARELRDRYLEHVNRDAGAAGVLSGGKYDVTRVTRALNPPTPDPAPRPRLLDAA